MRPLQNATFSKKQGASAGISSKNNLESIMSAFNAIAVTNQGGILGPNWSAASKQAKSNAGSGANAGKRPVVNLTPPPQKQNNSAGNDNGNGNFNNVGGAKRNSISPMQNWMQPAGQNKGQQPTGGTGEGIYNPNTTPHKDHNAYQPQPQQPIYNQPQQVAPLQQPPQQNQQYHQNVSPSQAQHTQFQKPINNDAQPVISQSQNTTTTAAPTTTVIGKDTVDVRISAWHTLAIPDAKSKDGLGTGNLHRKGHNYKPVSEEEVLRIQRKGPNKKGSKGTNPRSRSRRESAISSKSTTKNKLQQKDLASQSKENKSFKDNNDNASIQKNNDIKQNDRPSGFGTSLPQQGSNFLPVNPFDNQTQQTPQPYPPHQMIAPSHPPSEPFRETQNQPQQMTPPSQPPQLPQSQLPAYDNYNNWNHHLQTNQNRDLSPARSTGRSPGRVRSPQPNNSGKKSNNTYQEQNTAASQKKISAHQSVTSNTSTTSDLQKETSSRFVTRNRGQLLLTINVELDDNKNHAIQVHINDEPEMLAEEFCRLHNATDPEVLPAFVNLISEEKRKRLGYQ
ncbi:9394_t:CDS:2 [Ambispora leptoticha]|uniref:9394_t:CDS:1 n=1 Tax=Ambispora leptoticha TaxID=144679 RepID=A0A9N9C6T4_9GLOM|nr:9394_t:CDS:2 [Ambispora leptoticha]